LLSQFDLRSLSDVFLVRLEPGKLKFEDLRMRHPAVESSFNFIRTLMPPSSVYLHPLAMPYKHHCRAVMYATCQCIAIPSFMSPVLEH